MVGIILSISRLDAQDAIVTDPAWLDPEEPPADVLPAFKKRPKPGTPDEIKKDGLMAYALVYETLDEDGKRTSCRLECSNPHLEGVVGGATEKTTLKFVPAKRAGKAVAAACWHAMVFNPRSADEGRKDATPRVLAVAPAMVKKSDLPDGIRLPLVVWTKLGIDEKGRLQAFVFDDPAWEFLRPQVGRSLHLWRFAPARRDGKPVAAELKAPLIISSNEKPKPKGTLPKLIHNVEPVYPRELLPTGLRGEVLVEFTVDQTGAVRNPVIKRSSNPGFNDVALDAILKWKFEPSWMGGAPVSVQMQQPSVFHPKNPRVACNPVTVEEVDKEFQKNLPEKYRYDIAPKPKGVLMPVYPYGLLKEKVSGKASVLFLVDVEGCVSELKVVEATQPEFGLALAAVVESLSFIPAMRGGKPTTTVLTMTQVFHPDGVEQIVPKKDSALLLVEEMHTENIVSAKKLDVPLKPLSRRAPVFPSSLRDTAERGEAKIEVLINEDGRVCLPRVVEASSPAFGYAAVQAAADWRFEPPLAGGKTVVARAVVPFVFKQETPKHAPEIPVPEPKAP